MVCIRGGGMHEAHHLSFFCACASCSSSLYVGCWCWPPLAVGHHLYLMHIYCRHVQTFLTFTAWRWTHIFLYHPQGLLALHTPQKILLRIYSGKGTSISDEREISCGPWSHWLAGLFSVSVPSVSVGLSVLKIIAKQWCALEGGGCMKLTISLSFVLVLLVPLCFMLDAGAGLLLQWDIIFRLRQCI